MPGKQNIFRRCRSCRAPRIDDRSLRQKKLEQLDSSRKQESAAGDNDRAATVRPAVLPPQHPAGRILRDSSMGNPMFFFRLVTLNHSDFAGTMTDKRSPVRICSFEIRTAETKKSPPCRVNAMIKPIKIGGLAHVVIWKSVKFSILQQKEPPYQ